MSGCELLRCCRHCQHLIQTLTLAKPTSVSEALFRLRSSEYAKAKAFVNESMSMAERARIGVANFRAILPTFDCAFEGAKQRQVKIKIRELHTDGSVQLKWRNVFGEIQGGGLGSK